MATIRDYTITYESESTMAFVEATSKTKTSYAAIPTFAEVKVKFPNATGYSITGCFSDCVNMVHAPDIPNDITVMIGVFSGCTSLVDSPVIPDRVTTLTRCFFGCTSLATAPTLPNRSRILNYMFLGCTSLITGPLVPKRAESISHMFQGCTSLTGNLRIDASPTTYTDCFKSTTQPITIYGRSNVLDEIAATGQNENVTVWRPTCTWRTPVTNRVAGSRTTHTDMNRIADNVYLLGGYPEKYGYVNTDFVKDFEWSTIVADTNVMADELGVQRVTDSTSYINLNKMETIHQLYHEQSE